jgi:DNA-binding MarR family transcriptional regulator
MSNWSLLSSHAQLLISVAGRPSITTGELAQAIGTDMNRVYRIIADLVAEGYISKKRDGREFRYQIAPNLWLSEERRREIAVCDYLESFFRRKTHRRRKGV